MRMLFVLCVFSWLVVLGHAGPLPGVPRAMEAGAIATAAPDSGIPDSDGWWRAAQRQLVEWNILVNREIPKRMKLLRTNPSPWVVAGSLLAAFAYGVLHALGPGHGKMVVSSYFLTHGASWRRGAWMGAQVAISHVMGAVVMVLVTKVALTTLLTDPEAQVYVMRLASYAVIVLLGGWMLARAVGHLAGGGGGGCACCAHGGAAGQKTSAAREALLAWGVGVVPCTGSLLILLYAMAHNMLPLGLLMVAFVALGMALTLTALGMACIAGKRRWVDRLAGDGQRGHHVKAMLEVVGALLITLLGMGLVVSAL